MVHGKKKENGAKEQKSLSYTGKHPAVNRVVKEQGEGQSHGTKTKGIQKMGKTPGRVDNRH